MDNRPIGVFDSGLGGLTVLNELMKKFPEEKFIYLGDTKRFPYGQKSADAIIEISKKNIDFLISKDVKLIIIACGTVTSQALDTLKNIYDIPIIGIIEPTVINLKNRIKDNEKNIGVIATKGTIRSGAWEKSILKYIPDSIVINEPAPLLATMAEEGWTNNKVAEYTIKEYMKLFVNTNKLILGCTHYPLFRNLMEKELPENVEIIDVGREMAKYIEDNNILNISNQTGDFKIYVTDMEENFINSASKILSKEIGIDKIDVVEI